MPKEIVGSIRGEGITRTLISWPFILHNKHLEAGVGSDLGGCPICRTGLAGVVEVVQEETPEPTVPEGPGTDEAGAASPSLLNWRDRRIARNVSKREADAKAGKS